MYTNIDPGEGISTLRMYLDEYGKVDLNENLNIDFICELTKLVMEYNVFQFGDTWWKQLIGTAMGTPCACIYATLFFAYFERKHILTKYADNLLFFRRQIDDIFGIWIPSDENNSSWPIFKNDLNNFCRLDWNTEELSRSVNYLDLNIYIGENGKVQFKTYQKPMNLFLYIPANSAHPPGVIKSLIYGLLSTYHKQNTLQSDFTNFASLLYKRLIARGHQRDTIKPIFLEAAKKLDALKEEERTLEVRTRKRRISNGREQLFFHLPYHPRGISRSKLQNLYNTHCNHPDDFGNGFKSM